MNKKTENRKCKNCGYELELSKTTGNLFCANWGCVKKYIKTTGEVRMKDKNDKK